jgi:hypothetical protein
MKTRFGILTAFLALLIAIIACIQPIPTSNSTTDISPTQTALAMTLTAVSKIQPTPVPFPTIIPQIEIPPTEEPSPSAEDIQSRIESSNMLIYEDVAGYPGMLPYVRKALESFGGHHQYVADAMGTFLNYLMSDTKWDLIIVSAEVRGNISGDYWTLISDQVDNNVALIAEVWYLDKISRGKISPFLEKCGIEVQKDWERPFNVNPVEYEMFWVEPDSPVFNIPNQVNSFRASLPICWPGDAGDFINITEGSNAVILASHARDAKRDYGLITSCMEGRVILQTFSSHDYGRNNGQDMIHLWENYILYTLTNHFMVVP